MTPRPDYTQDPLCHLCSSPYTRHPQCQCCSIYCGPGHFQEEVFPYRGKKLCALCLKAWQRLDEKVGKEAPWAVFKNRIYYYNADDKPIKPWPVAEEEKGYGKAQQVVELLDTLLAVKLRPVGRHLKKRR